MALLFRKRPVIFPGNIRDVTLYKGNKSVTLKKIFFYEQIGFRFFVYINSKMQIKSDCIR